MPFKGNKGPTTSQHIYRGLFSTIFHEMHIHITFLCSIWSQAILPVRASRRKLHSLGLCHFGVVGAGLKRPIHSPLNCAISLFDITPDEKNLVNCAALWNILSSRFSQRELRSSQGVPQSPQLTCRHHDDIISRHSSELTKKLTNLMGNLCCARVDSVQFFVHFFTQLNWTAWLKSA
jgi:hypothetical protein